MVIWDDCGNIQVRAAKITGVYLKLRNHYYQYFGVYFTHFPLTYIDYANKNIITIHLILIAGPLIST
jgi:hypothetical protein